MKLVVHPFVAHMPVLVIVSQALPGILKLLWRLYGMRVVVPQNPLSVRFVERQGIADSVWDVCRYLDTPSLDLHACLIVSADDSLME